MILNQLTLRDFCLYGGTQVLDLAPTQRRGLPAPIVLFGGINGGGKTTLLDAVQLVLYGNRARCSKRGDKGYEQFLRKIDRLSRLVTESFRYLLRKQTLVERVLIDPDSFAITLYDDTGRAIPKQRLSEGEKQIFAVSVLWGLSRAAARPLPAIIDTPMARLDGKHRDKLVERYFPHASHQVIVLSTDTEIERR